MDQLLCSNCGKPVRSSTAESLCYACSSELTNAKLPVITDTGTQTMESDPEFVNETTYGRGEDEVQEKEATTDGNKR